jgi:hypothetical protein
VVARIAAWFDLIAIWNAKLDLTAAWSAEDLSDLRRAAALVLARHEAEGKAGGDLRSSRVEVERGSAAGSGDSETIPKRIGCTARSSFLIYFNKLSDKVFCASGAVGRSTVRKSITYCV